MKPSGPIGHLRALGRPSKVHRAWRALPRCTGQDPLDPTFELTEYILLHVTAEEVAERAFRELATDALELVQRSGQGIDELRGIPLYDTGKDELFQNLSS